MQLPLLCLLLASASAGGLQRTTETPQQKGIIDWISNLISGTTTTLRPVNDPPEDCPNCPRVRVFDSKGKPHSARLLLDNGSTANFVTSDLCECGIARTRRRIVGGYETKKLEFPWMAVLMYNGRFYCGGSLLNDYYVLTAAHCTSGFRKERITVRFLEHDRSQANETKTIERKVQAIIRHLRYNPGTYDNDIALLKLDQRVDLTNAVKKRFREDGSSEGSGSGEGNEEEIGLRPVCMPSAGLSYSNFSAVVAGWGTTEEGGSVANTLQEVYVPIISNQECRQTAYKNRITDNMLCAGEPEGGRDACQGDSGGPLHILSDASKQYQEVGIVSWGEGCARPDRPGVYTRVNRYMTWIKSNTKDACYCD